MGVIERRLARAESILFGEKQGCRRSIGFSNDPQFVSRRSRVTAQEAKTSSQAEFVFPNIVGIQFAPIALRMPIKKFLRLLSGLLKSLQGPRSSQQPP